MPLRMAFDVLFMSISLIFQLFAFIANADMIIANFIPVSKVQTCTEDSPGTPKEVDLWLNLATYPLHIMHIKNIEMYMHMAPSPRTSQVVLRRFSQFLELDREIRYDPVAPAVLFVCICMSTRKYEFVYICCNSLVTSIFF